MDVYEAIYSRRSVRDFKDKDIDEKILKKILDAGLQAPTNNHLRQWEFIIINDKEKRLEVIDKPCQDEAAQVTERPGDCSIDQCVLDCNQEHVVLEEQPQVVVYADKPGRLEHVEVGKAESYRHDDRDDRKQSKYSPKRKEKQIAFAVAVYLL